MLPSTLPQPTNDQALIFRAMAQVELEQTDPSAALIDSLQRQGRHLEAMLAESLTARSTPLSSTRKHPLARFPL